MPSDVAESQWFDAVSVYQCHTKHQHFGDGLYYTTHCNPFMVILGMLYFWVKKVYHIMLLDGLVNSLWFYDGLWLLLVDGLCFGLMVNVLDSGVSKPVTIWFTSIGPFTTYFDVMICMYNHVYIYIIYIYVCVWYMGCRCICICCIHRWIPWWRLGHTINWTPSGLRVCHGSHGPLTDDLSWFIY